MEIAWSDDARLDYEYIQQYIRFDNPSAAKKTAIKIFDSIEFLESSPLLGKVGRIIGTRDD